MHSSLRNDLFYIKRLNLWNVIKLRIGKRRLQLIVLLMKMRSKTINNKDMERIK